MTSRAVTASRWMQSCKHTIPICTERHYSEPCGATVSPLTGATACWHERHQHFDPTAQTGANSESHCGVEWDIDNRRGAKRSRERHASGLSRPAVRKTKRKIPQASTRIDCTLGGGNGGNLKATWRGDVTGGLLLRQVTVRMPSGVDCCSV